MKRRVICAVILAALVVVGVSTAALAAPAPVLQVSGSGTVALSDGSTGFRPGARAGARLTILHTSSAPDGHGRVQGLCVSAYAGPREPLRAEMP